MKKAVTIAGSDAAGGAGLEADLKTFQEFGVFGFAAITSIVTLDPANGKHTVENLDTSLLQKQITTAFAGPIDTIKTGLLPSVEIIELVSEFLQQRAEKIVVDPVINCKGSIDFFADESVQAIRKKLLPHAFITTPNLAEAGVLSELGELTTKEQMKKAAQSIHLLGAKNVVIKGGARFPGEEIYDLFFDGQEFHFHAHPRIHTENNHGAGCTFAAAITAALAKEYTVPAAISLAFRFVEAAIKGGEKINPYTGYVWHGAYTHAEKRLEAAHDKQ